MNATLRNALIAIAATMTAGAANAASWTNLPGTTCVAAFPGNTTNSATGIYNGWGLDFIQKAGTVNWVHCPVAASSSQTTDHIFLRYFQEAAGSISLVDIYNGDTMVKRLYIPAGTSGWNNLHLTFPRTYFGYGLSVSMSIGAIGRNAQYKFAGAGALWQ